MNCFTLLLFLILVWRSQLKPRMVKRGVYTGLEIVLLGVSSDTVLRRVVNIKVRDNGNNSSTSWIIQCFGYYGHGDSKKQNISKGMLELLVSGVINFLRSLRTKWIWSMHNSKCKSIIWNKSKDCERSFLKSLKNATP